METQREIKFRAWSVEDSVMFYSKDSNFCNMESDRPYRCDSGTEVIMQGSLEHINTHMPIMQYTGLKDRNGNGVYEGDILRSKNWSVSPYESKYKDIDRIVVWGDGSWELNTVDNNKVHSGLELKENNFKRYEIIGNIYEDRELLNE